MKKSLLIASLIAAVSLTACDKADKPTIEDYKTVEIAASANESVIAGIGGQGDYVMRLKETPELLEIAQKQKTTTFLSVTEPATYLEEGYCLLNIIPEVVMTSINPESTCFFRLFCGTAEDITNNPEAYAVELCR